MSNVWNIFQNPAYGRHQISRPMQIVAPIFLFLLASKKGLIAFIFFATKNNTKKLHPPSNIIIWNTFFDQRSPRPPEAGLSRCHKQTNRQTDGHCDSMTEWAQWADSVKKHWVNRFHCTRNHQFTFKTYFISHLHKTRKLSFTSELQ